jgi:hypothetical protein
MKTEYKNLDANSCRFAIGDNLYRFVLGESNKNDKNPLIFICINPSTATQEKLDPTSRKVKAISKANDHDSWIMLNVCSQRAVKPNALASTCDQEMHKKNIEVIKEYVKDGSTVVAAWGDSIGVRDYLITCLKEIINALNGVKINWKHLIVADFTNDGNPRHPLSLSANFLLNDFGIEAYINKNQGQPALQKR